MTQFEALSHHLVGWTKEHHENSSRGSVSSARDVNMACLEYRPLSCDVGSVFGF